MTFDRLAFWSNPKNAPPELKSKKFYPFTLPEFYVDKPAWSNIINDAIQKHVGKRYGWSILDLGCGTCRGLSDLASLGYWNLAGIEINPKALSLGKQKFHNLQTTLLMCMSVEEAFQQVSEEWDVIYSVGCLMHIPRECDGIFENIARSARHLIITAENERDENFMKYPRDYQKIFETLGWKQVEEERGDKYPPISRETIRRVFRRSR